MTDNGPIYPDAHVQLTGEDGNAFFIMGRVMGALRTAGAPEDALSAFVAEAGSGDFDHLLRTCVKWVDCS